MLILHANWSNQSLRLWAEASEAYQRAAAGHTWAQQQPESAGASVARASGRGGSSEAEARTAVAVADPRAARPTDGQNAQHPFAVMPERLIEQLVALHLIDPALVDALSPSTFTMRLPVDQDGPRPSDRLAASVGIVEFASDARLQRVQVEALEVAAEHAAEVLLWLDTAPLTSAVHYEHDLRYWIEVARFVIELLADQRFVPTLLAGSSRLRASWQPWLDDAHTREQLGMLIRAMPPVARAVEAQTELRDHPWPVLQHAVNAMVDALVRRALREDEYHDAIAGREPADDVHVAWLAGLLDGSDAIPLPADHALRFKQQIADWLSTLTGDRSDRSLHLCLRLEEPRLPVDAALAARSGAVAASGANETDELWTLSMHLRGNDAPDELLDVRQLWSSDTAAHRLLSGQHPAQLQDRVLRELARAGRVWPIIESSLSESIPQPLRLTTEQAYELLSEVRPVLVESGIEVISPAWWGQRSSRLGLRLLLQPIDVDDAVAAERLREHDHAGVRSGSVSAAGGNPLGLARLVDYHWQVAIGDETLSAEQFEQLARQRSPLVRVHGQWVEFRREDFASAVRLMREQPSGTATLQDAFRLAYGGRSDAPNLPVFGIDADGWVQQVLDATVDARSMPEIPQPATFDGSLRPYQLKGLRWLVFLDQFGFGSCLADDMGLGKTIQLIALLLHERETTSDPAQIGPTLIVVPTSVITNWHRELDRFGPSLAVMIHHGPERASGEELARLAQEHDVVITTYGLVTRDRDELTALPWHRVVLDEAQYIKNPPTKQTAAIRAMQTQRRIALTGTPLENRLSELWSIMEFCNPGHLATAAEFRRRFAVPVERHRDELQAERLRKLVQPFILRRLKTDPTVIQDLPELTETREFATLTPEQASLYEQVVSEMMQRVDESEGMQRRGLVLASLIKLKQICNHPAHFLKEFDAQSTAIETAAQPNRSGKMIRLLRLLEEVIAANDKALVFTQFRQMGHLLVAMLQRELDRDVLFMHGGTPVHRRDQLVDRFQNTEGGAPIFVLSLKAGGIGLNLTAANHVFHFDRWWNPAVEKQATDRAFRIGQTRNVHVHKFVCTGTLEERIDEMLELKSELANNIIGTGEHWITEMNSQQLRELFTLRDSAREVDA